MRLGGPASWNSDQNCTQNSARGCVGIGLQGVVGGLFDMKLTLSVRHNCLKLKMII